MKYFFREFLDGEVAAGRLTEKRRANVRKFTRAIRGSTGRYVYGENSLGYEYVMRRSRSDPDGARKNAARAMAALFRVPLLICGMAAARDGDEQLALQGISEYCDMVSARLTSLGIPKDSSDAVVNKYSAMAKKHAKLVVLFCNVNRERLVSVATLEQYFRIIAEGLKITIPDVPELGNKKFAEAMSAFTYSDEYYNLRNTIRKSRFIPEVEPVVDVPVEDVQ